MNKFPLSNIRRKTPPIQNGEYDAVLHGYIVSWKIEEIEYEATSPHGVRGWLNCVVSIKDNQAIIKFEN